MTAERWLFSDESDWLSRLAWVSVMTNTLQYKGYSVNIEYSAEDKVLYGKIDGIGDLVTFESENVDGIEGAFHNAVTIISPSASRSEKCRRRPTKAPLMSE